MATEKGNSVSAEVAREFLRQSAEVGTWTTAYAQKILGVDAAATRQALDTLAATGYIEPVGKSKKGGLATVRPGLRRSCCGLLSALHS